MTSDGGKQMAELPEVARWRLSRIVRGGDHPDAGLLTAFVEGTLSKTRRDDVFDHLAACSECNRLVALVAPEREVTSVRQPAEVRRRWFAWIPRRWAGAAAAAAVVVSAVVIARIGQQIKLPPAPSAVAEKAPPPGLTAQLPVPATVQPRTLGPTHKPSQRAPNSRQPAESAAAVSQQPPLVQVNPVIAAQGRPPVPGDVRDQMAFQTSMMSSTGLPPELSPSGRKPPVKAEPTPVVTANVPAAPVKSIEPLWSLSGAGVLQRSNDSGHTWAAVALPSRVPMRDLSVLGQNIWTGGDQGALYHSTDAGQTWTAVVPTSNGVPLSDDVVRIAFADRRHGWIATRNGDIWTTRDSGITWSLK
jgi:hypothetical protein